MKSNRLSDMFFIDVTSRRMHYREQAASPNLGVFIGGNIVHCERNTYACPSQKKRPCLLWGRTLPQNPTAAETTLTKTIGKTIKKQQKRNRPSRQKRKFCHCGGQRHGRGVCETSGRHRPRCWSQGQTCPTNQIRCSLEIKLRTVRQSRELWRHPNRRWHTACPRQPAM